MLRNWGTTCWIRSSICSSSACIPNSATRAAASCAIVTGTVGIAFMLVLLTCPRSLYHRTDAPCAFTTPDPEKDSKPGRVWDGGRAAAKRWAGQGAAVRRQDRSLLRLRQAQADGQ